MKTFSAALIAVSVLAAPAMAGGIQHHGRAHQSHPFDAKAQMHRHHVHPHQFHKHRHVGPHFRLHKKFGAHKPFHHSAVKATTVHTHG